MQRSTPSEGAPRIRGWSVIGPKVDGSRPALTRSTSTHSCWQGQAVPFDSMRPAPFSSVDASAKTHERSPPAGGTFDNVPVRGG